MPVRRHGRWMYPVDERILEYLEEETWGTPATIASNADMQNLDVDECYIEQRCEQLLERELIAPLIEGDEMYEITTLGLCYLRGDLDAGTLRRWTVG